MGKRKKQPRAEAPNDKSSRDTFKHVMNSKKKTNLTGLTGTPGGRRNKTILVCAMGGFQ